MTFFSRNNLLLVQLLVVLAASFVLSGCVTTTPEERWKPVVRHDGNQVHVVKWDDETLSAIASWYTGSSDNIDIIANANPTLDPLQVHLGDRVFIPQNLLKTRGDMSREFLNAFLSSHVVTVKTSSGAATIKTPRIIAPIPYKEKKGRVVSQDMAPMPDTNEKGAFPSSSPEPLAEDETGPQLFGPK